MIDNDYSYRKKSSNFNIQLFIIGIFLFADSRFFYLLPLPDFFGGSPFNKTLVSIFSVICMAFLVLLNKKVNLGNYSVYILTLYLFLGIQAIYERLYFQYSLSSILFNLLPFLILLMYFGIGTFLSDQKNFISFCSLCEWITIILCTLLLIQLLIYNRKHIMFLNFSISNWYTMYHVTANGRFSVVADGLVKVTVLISFYDMLFWKNISRKKTFIATISFLLALLSIVFVDQSRIYIIQSVISIIVIYFITNKNKINLKTVSYAFAIFLIGLMLLLPKITSIINALNDSSNGSSYARIGAINYYLSIIGNYLFTGLGIVNPDEGTFQYILIHGGEGIYYFDDIGIIGILASMGIVMVVWYVLILIKNFKLSFKIKNNNKKALSIGLSVMMLLGIMTGSYLDKERLMALLLTMLVIDFCSRSDRLCNNEKSSQYIN